MLSGLAFDLMTDFDVLIVTSRQLINDARAMLPAHEQIGGVDVHRVWSTSFGRGRLALRVLDYLSFYVSALWLVRRLVGPGDVVVAKTDPPMLSVAIALALQGKDAHQINWLQDVFPEVASALGLIKRGSRLERWLLRARNRSLRNAFANVVLSEGMGALVAGTSAAPVTVIPNWADGQAVNEQADAVAEVIRAQWGVGQKLVIGYCGNFGRVHDFHTLLEAATLLQDRQVEFVLVGDGVQRQTLLDGIKHRALSNVRIYPAEPEPRLGGLLRAVDVHAVTLARPLENLVVPSKLYGVLAAGRPVLYVGEAAGDIGRLLKDYACGAAVQVGDGHGAARAIEYFLHQPEHRAGMGRRARALFEARFERRVAAASWRELLRELLKAAV
ncbi:MAG: glycosyltransferase [Gammaproteobacteria bacterium]|nr:glycosyltransferase [Gammaproteobacteria bacterium]